MFDQQRAIDQSAQEVQAMLCDDDGASLFLVFAQLFGEHVDRLHRQIAGRLVEQQ